MLNSKILIFITVLIFIWTSGCQDGINPIENLSTENEELTENTPAGLAKATAVTTHGVWSFDLILSGECLGEDVWYKNDYQIVTHTTLDGSGGFHSILNYRVIDGFIQGLESGLVWKTIGAGGYHDYVGKVGEKHVIIFNDRYKAQHDGPDLIEELKVFFFVDANGNVIRDKNLVDIQCK